MDVGTILAIVIVILSIILVIATVLITRKQLQPTMNNIKDLKDLITQKQNFYLRESDHINNRVTDLTKRAETLQLDVEEKMVHFQDFGNEQGQFQTSLRYLQDHAGDYAKGISTNLKDELKEDGPKIVETFKRAFKKTAQKQKSRFQNKQKESSV